MKCNICGSEEFQASRKGVGKSVCANCYSNERTRALMLFLKKFDLPKSGMRVLHFAPEVGLARYIYSIVGSNYYETYDLLPRNYSFEFHRARRLDLCKDLRLLAKRRYDLIIHNHVLEHLPCNYTMVLLYLHALLTPEGYHAFSIPIRRGVSFSDDWNTLTRKERVERFGQGGHIRNFGHSDLDLSIGMIFNLERYNLMNFFSKDDLIDANISRSKWGASSASVFFLGRDQCPLFKKMV